MAVTILVGDALERLTEMPDESVHCVVTSPPYWGLRDYGVVAAIGLEPTFDEHVEALTGVFREVRRVLRRDGTLWLNYGDAYAGGGRGGNPADSPHRKQATKSGGLVSRSPLPNGLKPKDLMMMPARVALALQADGWWLRSEIVWAKPNPMPESVRDRPTCAHEKVFLLARRARYFYDAAAVRTTAQGPRRHEFRGGAYLNQSGPQPNSRKTERQGGDLPSGWHNSPNYREAMPNRPPQKTDKQRGHSRRHDGFNDRWDKMSRAGQQAGGANLRNVWQIATHPFPGAHFATFPPRVVEPCIRAGTSGLGCCAECGTPWEGPFETENYLDVVCSCDCQDAYDPVPCTVLDPFAGSGTVGLVADRLGRDATLIEINPEYAEVARRRIKDDAPLFTEVTA